jgi:hypothetical protein
MPESDLHRQLVLSLGDLIRQRRSGSWIMFLDCEPNIEYDGCPPMLDTVRPDIYARERHVSHVVIGEAKTSKDIDNPHTEGQLAAYFDHLSDLPSAELVLAVPYLFAGTAHRLCRSLKIRKGYKHIPFEIGGWMFGSRTICEIWRG